jgi:hypothetical protein
VIDRIEADFADPIGRVLATSIFGEAGSARVWDEVVSFCDRELAAGPADLLFFTMSVGAVFGLRLDDGRKVVLKVHLARERTIGSRASRASSGTSVHGASRVPGPSESPPASSTCRRPSRSTSTAASTETPTSPMFER